MENFWKSDVTSAGFSSGNNAYTVKVTVPGPPGGKNVTLLHARVHASDFNEAVDFAYHVIRTRTREDVSCG